MEQDDLVETGRSRASEDTAEAPGVAVDLTRESAAADLWQTASEPPLRTILDRLVAAAFGIDVTLIGQASRGRADIARARQVAMYLAHAECRLSFTDVGKLYGRDRTTVRHACEIIEEKREDPRFDQALQHLAAALAIILRSYGELDAKRISWRPQ